MIKIENVSFAYSGGEQEAALHEINLTIPDGQTVLLCGESGCGKTTLTRLINGLIPHYYEGNLTGKVMFDGAEIQMLPLYETAKKVGSVFQNPRSQFFNVDTTSEMAFGAENQGMPVNEIERHVKNTVKQLKIENLVDRSLFQLSGGEKQKIACASASVCEPQVLVLDEPSSNLDIAATDELRKLIEIWKSKGKTIIICEHRLFYLAEVADRVIYIKDGRINADLSMGELKLLPDDKLQEMGLRPLSLKNIAVKGQKQQAAGAMIMLKDFAYTYKKSKQDALDLPELDIPAHSIIAIIGNNGAGKSTLANCLCGLNKKDKSQVIVQGKSLTGKQRLGKFYMVMQDVNHQLFTESVADEVLLSMEETNAERVDSILQSLDLMPFKELHPMSLSGGQKQRVAIASAVASDCEYILFDEPTSGLDLRHMLEVSKIMQQLQQQGKTILLITHDLELIFKCCDHIIHLEQGKLAGNYAMDAEGKKKVQDYFGKA